MDGIKINMRSENNIHNMSLDEINAKISAYEKVKDYASGFSLLSSLLRSGRLNDLSYNRLQFFFRSMKATDITVDMEADILAMITRPSSALEHVSSVISRYLSLKFDLSSNSPIPVTKIRNDRLFCTALKHVLFTDIALEHALTYIRHSLMLEFIQNGSIDDQCVTFCIHLIHQLQMNEYVYLPSSTEVALCQELEKLLAAQLSQRDWDISQSAGVLVAIMLYKPLLELERYEQLQQVPLSQWPEYLQDVVERDLFYSMQERQLAATIKSISPINNDVSEQVRAQYESNPYPRWLAISPQKRVSATAYLNATIRGHKAPQRLAKKVRVLVAGCGTGRQPISVSQFMKNASITAVDLSRRSLAYAKRMAETLQAKNIHFYHGDILQLRELNQHFDIIICSGVLHHMDDPLAGWAVLRDLMAPDGVMSISLYSALARREVRQQRAYIQQLELSSSTKDIRTYRQVVMKREPDSQIIQWRDFWNVSECRDLLFHEREHQYSWRGIDEACQGLNLACLGVETESHIYKAFKTRFPDHESEKNLQNWHELECDNPLAFRAMYTFWCGHK